ncbi:conserved oligomeric Golgi complex subunit 4 [Trichomonascus vanleenenianus]|uniref:Golgi transport complex subunit COG4 n=1 Tax=Trichomonascus vanleenenianus TaxID=2268995 RepID=UPI003ECB61BE
MASQEEFHVLLSEASSEDDLMAILHRLDIEDASITAELENYVSSVQRIQNQEIKRLDMLRSQLGTAVSTSHEIYKLLSNTAYASTNISSKIRAIDAEKTRVQDTLQYVENVILLKSSIQGAADAMAARDWDKAAKYIHTANSLPEGLITSEFSAAMVPTSEIPDFPRDTLSEYAASLGRLFLKEFEKATRVRDMESVTRFFKLFPLIGQEKEGLTVYARFICGIITTSSRTLMQSRPGESGASSNMLFYGIAVSRLFENIATIVAQHAPIVEKHYGKGRMARVIDKIQDETDAQGGLIVDTFWDERRVEKILSDIKHYAYSFLVGSFAQTAASRISLINRASTASPESTSASPMRRSEDEGVDLKDAGNITGEIAIMLNRWTLYRKFIASRWDDFEGSPSLDSHHHLAVPKMLSSSGFSMKVNSRLIPHFEELATFVFRRSIEKAFQLEETPDLYGKYTPESPLVTSVVDDVMMILSRVLEQAVSTGEVRLVKSVIANMRRILESDYIGMVQRKLRDEAPKQQYGGTSTSRTNTPPPFSARRSMDRRQPQNLGGLVGIEEKRLRLYMIYLNNLSVTANYTERIVNSVQVEENFPFHDDAYVIRDLLNTLSDSFKARCQDLTDDGLRTVFNYVLKNKLQAAFNAVSREANYMVAPNQTEAKAGFDEGGYDMSMDFGQRWDDLVGEFGTLISANNYTRLLSLAAASLSKLLERWVWGLEGKVNELGAINLDRDIGRIISKVSTDRYHFREKFVRVAQMVMIVCLDETEEEEEGIAWSLDDEDRRKAKLIRVDRKEGQYY